MPGVTTKAERVVGEIKGAMEAAAQHSAAQDGARLMEDANLPAAARMLEQALNGMCNAAECSDVMACGATSIWREWMERTQAATSRYLDGMQSLARCQSPEEVYAVQAELILDESKLMVEGAMRTAEIAVQTLTDGVGILSRAMQPADRTL